MALSKGFRVYEKNNPPSYSILLEHRNKSETLLFESHALAILTQAETDAIKKQYTKIQDGYGVLGVLQINAGNVSILYLVVVTGCFSVGKIADIEIFRITQTAFIPLQFQQPNEDKTAEIKRLLNSGTFYFSWSNNPASQSPFDITLCAQKCYREIQTETDNRFFWNRMLHIHFLRYGIDCSSWLIKVMCGSAEIRTVYARTSQARVAIISRLSCERTGTRFNVRGVNDDGHVANFVETEQSIYLDAEITSYVQTRGSVPLFWEQPGVQVGSHKVKLSRGYECSRAAFEKHIETLKYRYGKQAIVNLLGTSLIGSKEGEAMLSVEFQRHHKESNHSDVPHIVFDYHQECRGGNMTALNKVKSRLEQVSPSFGFCYVTSGKIQSEQTGTIRTNCLDCLDRTNCAQTFLGLEVLKEQIEVMGLGDKKQNSRFEEVFRQMWINNGNEISKIYAGTGAIQGSSKIIDGARSAARTIQNNLLDNPKQEAIDIFLLGSSLSTELADRARILLPSNLLHAPVPLLRELCSRFPEYTEKSSLSVAIGTYNVNGGKHFRSVVYKDVSLADWLLDSCKNASEKTLVGALKADDGTNIDIFAIGFQEIVDLNASNIMAASSENAKAWAEELQKILGRDRQYSLLTYHQLVGVCLYVFVKPEHGKYIKDVAIDSVKTGLGGTTGNKGAVAIRFVYKATSMCFVCSHFAAGQSQVTERNADFAEITRKIMFPMGRTLKSHDYVFWCGDFNYRIDMDKEELKECVKNGELSRILENDQLKKQQEAGNVFVEYHEGEIDFDPTYKYDLFSDDYDTSEKARAPAWTDRVLWKKRRHMCDEVEWNPGKVIHYGRAELKQSDHRPVIALLEIDIMEISTHMRQQVINDVVSKAGPTDCTLVIQLQNNSSEQDEEEDDGIFDETTVNALIQELSSIGELTLVRFTEDTMYVTFRDGQQTLNAFSKESTTICGKTFEFNLKTPKWAKEFEKEIALCSANTIPMVLHTGDYNCLGIPEVKLRPKSPPSRPPLPKSPVGTPKKTPKVGVISVTAFTDSASKLMKEQDNYELPQNENAIYEEIKDSAPSAPPPIPQRRPPPPPAPKIGQTESHVPTSNSPVIPPRRELPPVPTSKAPPPIPARNNP